jgi:hypothetical protein
MAALDPDQRAEIEMVFPGLVQAQQARYLPLSHWEAAAVLAGSAAGQC